MDARACRGNRIGLALTGIVLLAGGAETLARGLGWYGPEAAGRPLPGDAIAGYLAGGTMNQLAAAGPGIALALTGLGWLFSQVHAITVRTRRLRPERGADRRFTKAVMEALATEARAYPGVRRVRCRLLGTSRHPWLSVTFGCDERADLAIVRDMIEADVAPVREALGIPRLSLVIRFKVPSSSGASGGRDTSASAANAPDIPSPRRPNGVPGIPVVPIPRPSGPVPPAITGAAGAAPAAEAVTTPDAPGTAPGRAPGAAKPWAARRDRAAVEPAAGGPTPSMTAPDTPAPTSADGAAPRAVSGKSVSGQAASGQADPGSPSHGAGPAGPPHGAAPHGHSAPASPDPAPHGAAAGPAPAVTAAERAAPDGQRADRGDAVRADDRPAVPRADDAGTVADRADSRRAVTDHTGPDHTGLGQAVPDSGRSHPDRSHGGRSLGGGSIDDGGDGSIGDRSIGDGRVERGPSHADFDEVEGVRVIKAPSSPRAAADSVRPGSIPSGYESSSGDESVGEFLDSSAIASGAARDSLSSGDSDSFAASIAVSFGGGPSFGDGSSFGGHSSFGEPETDPGEWTDRAWEGDESRMSDDLDRLVADEASDPSRAHPAGSAWTVPAVHERGHDDGDGWGSWTVLETGDGDDARGTAAELPADLPSTASTNPNGATPSEAENATDATYRW